MKKVIKNLDLINKLKIRYEKDENDNYTKVTFCRDTEENIKILEELGVTITEYNKAINKNDSKIYMHEILRKYCPYYNSYVPMITTFYIDVTQEEKQYLQEYKEKGYRYIQCLSEYFEKETKIRHICISKKNNDSQYLLDSDFEIRNTNMFKFMKENDDVFWDIDWLLQCHTKLERISKENE